MTSVKPSDGNLRAGDPARKPTYIGIWSGIAAIVFAVAYGLLGESYGIGSARAPGAGIFPVLVAVLVGASGVIMVARGLRGDTSAEEMLDAVDDEVDAASVDGQLDGQTGGEGAVPGPRIRIATVIGTLIVYVVAVTWIGHLITATVVAAVAVRLLGGRPWWQAICFSVAIAACTQLLFGSLLGLPLPSGLYGPRL